MDIWLAAIAVLLAGWAIYMAKKCKFRLPPDPHWPDAAYPGLALEFARTLKSVDNALGPADTKVGIANRHTARQLQYLDFFFIPIYVAFFIVAAGATGAQWRDGWPIYLAALLAGTLDVFEDIRILGMLNGNPGPAQPFGRWKWILFFATFAGEGIWLLLSPVSGGTLIAAVVSALLICIAVGGTVSSLKNNLSGVVSAAGLSALGLAALTATPFVLQNPALWSRVVQYGVLMRVPLLCGLLLIALPLVAFYTPARSILKGLFDLTPPSLFVSTLTALALSGTVCATSSIVLAHGYERTEQNDLSPFTLPPLIWMAIMTILALPIILYGVQFSIKQRHGRVKSIAAALAGTAVALGLTAAIISSVPPLLLSAIANSHIEAWLAGTNLFRGYVSPNSPTDPWVDHVGALVALAATLLLYLSVGFYGWLRLGKSNTVPALCSALMLVMMLCWMLSALAFFFDAWRVPTLLIVAVVGFITAQSQNSDHFYDLRMRWDVPAPGAADAIAATNEQRVIVVAANGGGIQAAAWAAKVLYGLYEDCGLKFTRSLRMISSVSGGSVGSIFFMQWLATPGDAVRPDRASVRSSLDEVAWGLGWTDFLRGLVPWLFQGLIGRGRALERAWLLSSAVDASKLKRLDAPLSSWNQKTASGELPALIMNATIAETGERLLLGTTTISRKGRARKDASELHTINGEKLDVGIITAARLSASFPYVTPAARSKGPGPQPHVVDGGYYDNYGMATLVEWLDEGLEGAGGRIKHVLVIQIHGAAIAPGSKVKRYEKNRGWFYQAIAPLTALAAVRNAGQVAHNDIELGVLAEKWAERKTAITATTFEFRNPAHSAPHDATEPPEDPQGPPLSWHLTPDDIDAIDKAWQTKMGKCRKTVKDFLDGAATEPSDT